MCPQVKLLCHGDRVTIRMYLGIRGRFFFVATGRLCNRFRLASHRATDKDVRHHVTITTWTNSRVSLLHRFQLLTVSVLTCNVKLKAKCVLAMLVCWV
jgi:hypothetical protein